MVEQNTPNRINELRGTGNTTPDRTRHTEQRIVEQTNTPAPNSTQQTPSPVPAPETPVQETRREERREERTDNNDTVHIEEARQDTLNLNESSEERIVRLREQNQTGILSLTEAAELANANKDKETKGNTGETGRTFMGEKPKKEKRDLFKEDDIIHYMYNEWLIGGANWLFSEGVYALELGWYHGEEAFHKTSPKNAEKNKVNKTETFKGKQEIDKLRIEKGKKTAEICDNDNQFVEYAERIRVAKETGTLDQIEGLSPEAQIAIRKMKPEEFNNMFGAEAAKKMQQNLTNNMKTANQIALNLAAADMVGRNASTQNHTFHPSPEKFFDAHSQEKLQQIAIYMDKCQALGKDPAKEMNEMMQLSNKAFKHASDQVDKGNFKDNGREHPKNKHLEAMYARMNQVNEEYARQFPDQAQSRRTGFLETAIENNKTAAEHAQTVKWFKDNQQNLNSKQEEVKKKRERIKDLKKNLKDNRIDRTINNMDALKHLQNNNSR